MEQLKINKFQQFDIENESQALRLRLDDRVSLVDWQNTPNCVSKYSRYGEIAKKRETVKVRRPMISIIDIKLHVKKSLLKSFAIRSDCKTVNVIRFDLEQQG